MKNNFRLSEKQVDSLNHLIVDPPDAWREEGWLPPGPAPEGAVTLVCLGDLYADSCSVCGKRAEWGIASQSGPHGCTEAIKAGRCFCDDHLPKVTREPSDKPTPPEPSGSPFLSAWQAWERRTGKAESKLEMYSDGSGEFTERDLYGPKHAFNSLEQLAEILKP